MARTLVVFVAWLALACARSIVRDNFVAFPGPDTISWRETAHAITGGQVYDGTSTKNWSIHISASRLQSAAMADEFGKGLNDTNMLGVRVFGSTTRPATLHFVSFGSLTANFTRGDVKTCDKIRIGQGHTLLRNNWWIAGENCVRREYALICERCGLLFEDLFDDLSEEVASYIETNALRVRRLDPKGVSIPPDNVIRFPGPDSISWRETKHVITAGEVYDGTSTKNVSVHISASRLQSAAMADEFGKGLNDTNMLGVEAFKWTTRPATLHFVSFGSLTANFTRGDVKTCDKIRIGQGHTLLRNNWWIAGEDCVRQTMMNSRRALICERCGLQFEEVEEVFPGGPARIVDSFRIRELVAAVPAVAVV